MSAILAFTVISLVFASGCTSLKVPTIAEYLTLEQACADILDVSEDLRVHIRRHQYPDTAESHRFAYCTAVLFFEYNRRHELDMDLMYAVFGQNEGRDEFGRQKLACYERNEAYGPGLDKFEKLYRMYACYAERYQSFFEHLKDDE